MRGRGRRPEGIKGRGSGWWLLGITGRVYREEREGQMAGGMTGRGERERQVARGNERERGVGEAGGPRESEIEIKIVYLAINSNTDHMGTIDVI